jgi:hypothetical protein
MRVVARLDVAGRVKRATKALTAMYATSATPTTAPLKYTRGGDAAFVTTPDAIRITTNTLRNTRHRRNDAGSAIGRAGP